MKIFVFLLSFLLISCDPYSERDVSNISFQDAHRELILQGVDIKVNFDSSEDRTENGTFVTVPCIAITDYTFFAITETPSSIGKVIESLNILEQSIQQESSGEDYNFCESVGFTFSEIKQLLNECKNLSSRGEKCF